MGEMFDVSLLMLDDGIFEIKATTGHTHQFGQDSENHMVTHFVNAFRRKRVRYRTNHPRSLRRLCTACERAKGQLSSSTQFTIEMNSLYEDLDYNISMTRAKFK